MLQGDALVFTGFLYSVGLLVIGFFIGKRNGDKTTDLMVKTAGEATILKTQLETRVRALEDAVVSGLNVKLTQAKQDTAKAVETVKQSLAQVEVKPETVAQAIVTEIKKVE